MRDRHGMTRLELEEVVSELALKNPAVNWPFGPAGLMGSKTIINVPTRIEEVLRNVFMQELEYFWWNISCTVSYAFNQHANVMESPTPANWRYALLEFIREAKKGPEFAHRIIGKRGLAHVALASIAQVSAPDKRIDSELDLLIEFAQRKANDLRSRTGRPANSALNNLAHGIAGIMSEADLAPTTTVDGKFDRCLRALLELAEVPAGESAIRAIIAEAIRTLKRKAIHVRNLPTFHT